MTSWIWMNSFPIWTGKWPGIRQPYRPGKEWRAVAGHSRYRLCPAVMTAMVPVRCFRLMWLAASRDCRTIRPEMATLFRGNGRRQKPVMSGCRLQAGMNDCRRLPHSICRRYGASGWSAKRDRHRPKWRGCRGRKRKRGYGRRHPEKECPLRRLPDRNFWKRLCRWWKNCWQKAGETDAAGRGITR